MNIFKKFILATALIATLAAPLAGCSRTWDGVKDDWHNMTGSDGDERPGHSEASHEAHSDGWSAAPRVESGPSTVNP